MAVGETTTQSLPTALPRIIAKARIQREWAPNTWRRTTTMERQQEGTGLDWIQNRVLKLDAQDITELQRNENFQMVQADEISVEPQMTQILVKQTRRSNRKLSKNVTSLIGQLAGVMSVALMSSLIYLAVGFIALTSLTSGQPIFLDVSLALALIAFVAVVAFARYVEESYHTGDAAGGCRRAGSNLRRPGI
jgi:multisubunit Na+/H+ antiporter MnhF subunit